MPLLLLPETTRQRDANMLNCQKHSVIIQNMVLSLQRGKTPLDFHCHLIDDDDDKYVCTAFQPIRLQISLHKINGENRLPFSKDAHNLKTTQESYQQTGTGKATALEWIGTVPPCWIEPPAGQVHLSCSAAEQNSTYKVPLSPVLLNPLVLMPEEHNNRRGKRYASVAYT